MSDEIGKWMLLCILVGYGIALLAYGVQCQGADCGQAWFGSSGIVSLAGPGVAAVAVFFAYKSYQTSAGVSRATRYQKAAEMLSATGEVSRAASIPVLRALAREDRKNYYVPVLKTLIEFAAASDDDFKHRLEAFVKVRAQREPITLPRSRMSGNEAVSAIGRIWEPYARRMPDELDLIADGRLVLHNLYLAGSLYAGDEFAYMDWRLTVLHQVDFDNCSFADSVLRIAPQQRVTFRNCNLTNCRFELFDIDGETLTLISSRHIVFVGGERTGATVWDRPLDEWAAESQSAGGGPLG